MGFCKGDTKCLIVFLSFLILIFSFVNWYSKWIILASSVLIFINSLLDLFFQDYSRPGFFSDGTPVWRIFFREKNSEKVEPSKKEIEEVLNKG